MGGLDESALIAHLTKHASPPSGVRGIGDDACVWSPTGTTCLSVDSVVEGRHFTRDDPDAAVGRKAAAAAVSDLAAMAAQPVGAAVALHCPAHRDAVAVMDGLHAELQRLQCPLLGGDTTASDSLVIAVTVWGQAWPESRLLHRDGGQPGDLLIATGHLGGSLRQGRHLSPEPRIEQAKWLAERSFVRALMDISDGLASDAPRMAAASGCGCMLMPENLKVHPDVPPASDIYHAAMCDGEDYELLAAVDPTEWPMMQLAWPFPDLPISIAGVLTAERDMLMEIPNTRRVQPLEWRGFEHRNP